ncbi:Uncharacterized protein FWK35_00012645 [Aphis craccivora]|uniref:Uncharacterized protein n=1 Tax=Aphis craccivora TaxID=307492 RepID=A0A6G0YH09_APHCR|nr:Uncharacterized protein FWK35_00012645 [Aphis craccivora]
MSYLEESAGAHWSFGPLLSASWKATASAILAPLDNLFHFHYHLKSWLEFYPQLFLFLLKKCIRNKFFSNRSATYRCYKIINTFTFFKIFRLFRSHKIFSQEIYIRTKKSKNQFGNFGTNSPQSKLPLKKTYSYNRLIKIVAYTFLIMHVSTEVFDSERSDECIDFTMIITSRNNALISKFGDGEYPQYWDWKLLKKSRKTKKNVTEKREILRKTSFRPNRTFLYSCNSKTNHCKYLKFSPNFLIIAIRVENSIRDFP